MCGKLLYVSFENAENQASGVNKKIIGQINTFKEFFKTDLIATYGNNIAFFPDGEKPVVHVVKNNTRIALCHLAENLSIEYDYAYVRFQFFCPFVLNMLKSFKKNGLKTIMEIPTYPYKPELKKQGLRGVPKRIIDSLFGYKCTKYIDSFASPLFNDNILCRPCIEIRNGIDSESVVLRNPIMHKGEIHILAVAMMAPWHGYDRLIEGMKKYYSNERNIKVILHLIGQGVSSAHYQELIEKYHLSDYIIQHGKVFGDELDNLYNLADIGAGSLGIHRTEINRTNTLKIMEYLAKGIPVICEPSEIGVPLDCKYRLTVPGDDSPIDVDSIVNFYSNVYSDKDIISVIEEIRSICELNCNVKIGLQGVLDFLLG